MSNIIWNGESPMIGNLQVDGNSIGDTSIQLPPGEFAMLAPFFFNPIGTVSLSVFQLQTEIDGGGVTLFTQAMSGLNSTNIILAPDVTQRVSDTIYLRNTVLNSSSLLVNFNALLIPLG